MSALFGPAMLAAIQAFAGNAANFLDRTLEWPWYAFWAQAFYGAFDPTKVIAGPQYEIAKQIRSNDGKCKIKKKFPDFALHYLSGIPNNHDINNLPRVTNHEELLQFYMGRFVLVDSFLLAICEIKPLPDPKAVPADETFQSVLHRAIVAIQGEARLDAERQAALYLSSKRNIHSVVAIAAFGPHFSWKVFTQDTVTGISSNEDPTFITPESDDSDSTSDSFSANLRQVTRNKRAPRTGTSTTIGRPGRTRAAGSSNQRPKRKPQPVETRKYSTRSKQAQVVLLSESSESEGKGSIPIQKIGRKGKVTQSRKGAARKGKSIMKGKTVNKANSQPKKESPARTEGKGKGKADSEPQALLLELPPLLELPAEHRGEATRDGDPIVEESTSAASGRPLGTMSSTRFTEQNSGTSDHEHAPAVDIPLEELDWSDWYNWSSDDGIQERAKMLNAIQRQYPNFPCLLCD